MKTKIQGLAAAHLQLPEFVGGMVDEVGMPALHGAVNKTATKLDDMALAALAPILVEELKERMIELYYVQLLEQAPKAE